MSGYENDLAACLSDAGFSKEAIGEAVRLCEAGQKEDLIRFLRVKRCGLIEELHESTLFNAPVTIDSYYQSRVNHDLYGVHA